MNSNKDLYLEEYYRNGLTNEIAMRQEYEAWQAWQALLAWADDRIRQSEQFFLDLRQPGLEPVNIVPEDEWVNEEYRWFLAGESLEAEARQISFYTQWRIPA